MSTSSGPSSGLRSTSLRQRGLRGREGRPGLEQGLHAGKDGRPAVREALENVPNRLEAVVHNHELDRTVPGVLDVEGDLGTGSARQAAAVGMPTWAARCTNCKYWLHVWFLWCYCWLQFAKWEGGWPPCNAKWRHPRPGIAVDALTEGTGY